MVSLQFTNGTHDRYSVKHTNFFSSPASLLSLLLSVGVWRQSCIIVRIITRPRMYREYTKHNTMEKAASKYYYADEKRDN